MPDSGYAENQAETGLVRSTNFRPAVNKSSGRLSNQVIGAAQHIKLPLSAQID
jgi:hypothetical protein